MTLKMVRATPVFKMQVRMVLTADSEAVVLFQATMKTARVTQSPHCNPGDREDGQNNAVFKMQARITLKTARATLCTLQAK